MYIWIYNLKDLTIQIRKQIGNINTQLIKLQNINNEKGEQIEQHKKNLIVQLQNKLANTSMEFKQVLETRSQVRNF